jgi:ribosome recycling factor
MDEIVDKTRESMEKRVSAFDNDLAKVRTGRASITLLDGVNVDYYGAPTPLNQVATLSTPDARTIIVAPFEKKIIGDIERAIMIADLGANPTNDGLVVRIPIPVLTEERRKNIVKNLKKMGEDTKVAIRHARRNANDSIKKAEKDKILAEDESKKLQDLIQKQTDSFVKTVDEKLVVKEKEVLTL